MKLDAKLVSLTPESAFPNTKLQYSEGAQGKSAELHSYPLPLRT